jgi:hypothetical protein
MHVSLIWISAPCLGDFNQKISALIQESRNLNNLLPMEVIARRSLLSHLTLIKSSENRLDQWSWRKYFKTFLTLYLIIRNDYLTFFNRTSLSKTSPFSYPSMDINYLSGEIWEVRLNKGSVVKMPFLTMNRQMLFQHEYDIFLKWLFIDVIHP